MADPHPFGAALQRSKDGYLLCAGCRTLGQCRLGIVSDEMLADGRTITRAKCPADQEGGPRVAHGGWTASVMDEMFGHLAMLQGLFVVTSKLNLEYLKPVPVERDLIGHAWVEKRENDRWHVAGELRLAGTDTLLTRGHGIFVERDLAHYQRYERWLAEQDGSAKEG